MTADALEARLAAVKEAPIAKDDGALLLELYRTGGIAAFDAIFARGSHGNTVRAEVYLALSKALHPADLDGSRVAARRAFVFRPTEAHRKWLAFRSFDTGDAGEAWALLKGLGASASLAPWEKRRRSAILERVKEAGRLAAALQNPVELLRERGLDGVTAEILARAGEDATARASELVRVAKLLSEAGHPEAEASLLAEALRWSRDETTLRAAYYAAQRSLDFETALACVAELEDLFGPDPTEDQKKLLRKFKTHSSYRLSILVRIPPRRARRRPVVPRRLCYVLHNSLPYSSSGYSTRSQGLAQGLIQNGWDVHCVTRPGFPLDMTAYQTAVGDAPPPPTDTHADVTYHRITEPSRLKTTEYDYLAGAAEALERTLEDLRPEMVMAASNHMTAIPALIAARRIGAPFAYEVRGLWEVTRASREPNFMEKPAYAVDVLLDTGCCNAADQVFTLTEPMREELIRRGVTTPVTLLPNSCDVARFKPGPRDPDLARRLDISPGVSVVGYVGSIVQYEGIDDLARACAILAARGLDFRLLIVGDELTRGEGEGPVTTEIRRVAAECGLGDRLIMTGRVPHDEVESYYSLIDVAPFPRKPQPVTEIVSPLKPLEALALEKAVVVSSVRALAEMIEDGRTGLVFEKGSVDRLADALHRLIADPALRASLGEAGRAWVERERTWRSTARVATERLRLLDRPGVDCAAHLAE